MPYHQFNQKWQGTKLCNEQDSWRWYHRWVIMLFHSFLLLQPSELVDSSLLQHNVPNMRFGQVDEVHHLEVWGSLRQKRDSKRIHRRSMVSTLWNGCEIVPSLPWRYLGEWGTMEDIVSCSFYLFDREFWTIESWITQEQSSSGLPARPLRSLEVSIMTKETAFGTWMHKCRPANYDTKLENAGIPQSGFWASYFSSFLDFTRLERPSFLYFNCGRLHRHITGGGCKRSSKLGFYTVSQPLPYF